ncbi:MAG: A/G-specific adenine glycosylase [Patescibacteria group bacterium]
MKNFQTYILWWYSQYGRTHLPWRQTTDPYRILVSELMLQQTQVDRVIPKYNAFLKQFPTVQVLATARLGAVLTAWQGLGYNRRAKYLHQLAQTVTRDASGIFPKSETELLNLPGVGSYTASAITAFAYNQPTVVIETNIRAVYIYHFFPEKSQVKDDELLLLISDSLYKKNPRLWYSALMDYGTQLKKIFPNPNRNSRQYARQSTFQGSLRQTRGEIIRMLSVHSNLSETKLLQQLTSNPEHHAKALESLIKEQLVLREKTTIRLA